MIILIVFDDYCPYILQIWIKNLIYTLYKLDQITDFPMALLFCITFPNNIIMFKTYTVEVFINFFDILELHVLVLSRSFIKGANTLKIPTRHLKSQLKNAYGTFLSLLTIFFLVAYVFSFGFQFLDFGV